METVTEYMPKHTDNMLNNLIKSVTKLEKEMRILKHRKKIRILGVTEEVLAKEWDNEFDERWNKI